MRAILDGTLSMVLMLFAVALLILYLSHIFSKFVAAGTLKAAQSKYMKVVDRIVIGQDRMMLIIQVQNKFFLVGSTSSAMTLISELPPEDMANLVQDQSTAQETSFKAIFLEHIKPKFRK